MNTINRDETSRPFGFWLKATDRLMAAEFASAFESEGITRREWRLLNIVDGSVPAGRPKSDRPLPAHKLARLIELGWVTDADGTWTLTDEGRTTKERLSGIVDGIRAKVTDAVPAEDLATTMTTLERLARAFGWDEETPLSRGRGRRGFDDHRLRHRGFGPRGFGPRGFGRRGHGFGHPAQRFDHEGHAAHERHDGHEGYEGNGAPGTSEREDCHHGGPHDYRGGHGRARFARFAQGAYERGFDAGFTRGRDDR